MNFDSLFEQFVQERRYLKNLSELTIQFYKDIFGPRVFEPPFRGTGFL
jgi:hypothetical protein